MFDFLWVGGSNSTSTPTRAAAAPPNPTNLIPRSDFPLSDLPAAQRCIGSCTPGSLGFHQSNHFHPAEHIPPHIHVHNVSHAHSLIFLGNPNRTIWHNYSYPHQHGGQASSQGFQGHPGGIGGALSSWYQLNLGLIGIGALAVVAIIGSRNFFSNYVYYKKSKHDSEYYDYEPYDNGGYYRRDWYDEWYDRWYREHGYTEDELDQNSYDDHRFEGDQKNRFPYKSRYKRDMNSRAKQANPYVDTGQPSNRSGQNDNKYGPKITEGLHHKRNRTDTRKTVAHCAFRLTCELTRERKRMLSEVEWNMLRQTRFKQVGVDVFTVREDDGKSSSPALEDYNAAQKLGVQGFECEKLTGSCPLRLWQIRMMLSQFEKKLKLSDQLRKNVRSSAMKK